MEIKNKYYTQKFWAKSLSWKDLFWPVVYTDYQGAIPPPPPCWYRRSVGHTGFVDLTQSMEDIFAAFKTKTRNEVRRAEKEGFTFGYNYDYETFVPFYKDFSNAKGLHENVVVGRLDKYDRTIITFVKNGDTTLVMHATVVNQEEGMAMLLYSGSIRLDENIKSSMVGWANRYCHYKDFVLFKSMGIKTYDWNGVTTDPEDKARYGIGLFKQEFGGVVRERVNLQSPLFYLIKNIQNRNKK